MDYIFTPHTFLPRHVQHPARERCDSRGGRPLELDDACEGRSRGGGTGLLSRGAKGGKLLSLCLEELSS